MLNEGLQSPGNKKYPPACMPIFATCPTCRQWEEPERMTQNASLVQNNSKINAKCICAFLIDSYLQKRRKKNIGWAATWNVPFPSALLRFNSMTKRDLARSSANPRISEIQSTKRLLRLVVGKFYHHCFPRPNEWIFALLHFRGDLNVHRQRALFFDYTFQNDAVYT